MRKIFVLLMSVLMLVSASAFAEEVKVGKGSVTVYDFGENKLYAYASGDALNDYAYAIETAEGIVLIESTAFISGNAAWKGFLETLNKPVAGKLMAFHPNGSDIYSDEEAYATENALMNWREGGSIRGLTDGFVAAFGEDVDTDLPKTAQIVNFGDTVTLGGIDFIIRNEGDDAYGIEIPAINCVYIHMLGSDVHNILTSLDHIQAFKAELESFDYELVLTSHNKPEGKDGVATKIAYLDKVAELAATCKDAASFIEAMNEAFPNYSGANYLEMIAGFLFPEN